MCEVIHNIQYIQNNVIHIYMVENGTVRPEGEENGIETSQSSVRENVKSEVKGGLR